MTEFPTELRAIGWGDYPKPAISCDICHRPILEDESYLDDGDEIGHTTCVHRWFRGNFGPEDLR